MTDAWTSQPRRVGILPESLSARMATFFVLGLSIGVTVGGGWMWLTASLTSVDAEQLLAPLRLNLKLSAVLLVAAAIVIDAVRPPVIFGLQPRVVWVCGLGTLAILCLLVAWQGGDTLAPITGLVGVGVGAGLMIAVEALRIESARSAREQGPLFGAQLTGAYVSTALLSLLYDGQNVDNLLLPLAMICFMALGVFMASALNPAPLPPYPDRNLLRRGTVSPMVALTRSGGGAGLLIVVLLLVVLFLEDLAVAIAPYMLALDIANIRGELPPGWQDLGNYEWIVALAGGLTGAIATWHRHPAPLFVFGLFLFMALTLLSVVLYLSGETGPYSGTIMRFLIQFVGLYLTVVGFVMVALIARPPFTAIHVAVALLFWGSLRPSFSLQDDMPEFSTTEVALIGGLPILLAGIAGFICWRWLKHLRPQLPAPAAGQDG